MEYLVKERKKERKQVIIEKERKEREERAIEG